MVRFFLYLQIRGSYNSGGGVWLLAFRQHAYYRNATFNLLFKVNLNFCAHGQKQVNPRTEFDKAHFWHFAQPRRLRSNTSVFYGLVCRLSGG